MIWTYKIIDFRKFFGGSSGVTPKPQQSRLTFKNPTSSTQAKQANGDVKGISGIEDAQDEAVQNEGRETDDEKGDGAMKFESRPQESSSKTKTEDAEYSDGNYYNPILPSDRVRLDSPFHSPNRRLSKYRWI